MNYYIIIFIIILVLAITYNLFNHHYSELATNLTFWKKKYGHLQKKIISFIQEIIPYFEKYKVTYWMHAGTLLGAIRHQGFIPWDDDVDFGYISDDDNVNNMVEELKKNYIISYYFFGFKIIHKQNSAIFIDMFTYTIDNDIVKQTLMSETMWSNENYYLNELFPTKKIKFEDMLLPAPHDPNAFCERAFKKNYMDIYYIQHPHYDNFFDNIIDSIGILSVYSKQFLIKDLH
jgi:phosphorylcholine metabolism protein LicD